MSIDTAIARFRSRQAEQFTDSVVVSRLVGDAVTNPTTGRVTRTYTTVYEGDCKIRPADRSGRDATAGETELRFVQMTGKFPIDQDIVKDDVVTVVDSLYDATMVGRQYRVTDAAADAWQIAKVAGLEETNVPELNLDSA